MKFHRIATTKLTLLLGICYLAGCAHTAAKAPESGEANAGSARPGVEEVVRVPTEETRPDDVPAGLLDADVAAEESSPTLMITDVDDTSIAEMYRIGPTDVLGFRSFDDESLNSDGVEVRHDGHISLPWIADLKVAGLTRDDATELIREAYQELYYEAEVSLQILQANSRTYKVMGDVNRPSEYPYVKPISLLDAIVTAGSLRVNQRGGDSFVGGQGQLVKALVIRGVGEEREVLEFDLRGMETGGTHQTQALILPGDTVFIPEGLNLVYLLGEVRSPGIQPLPEGMTLLQLLASAGGFNESTARMRQVVLIREVNETETEVQLLDVKEMLKTGADFLVSPGDIVYVPRKRLVNLGEFISRATGVVTPIMGVTSQALGLYSQVWDAFYTKERIDLLYNTDNSSQLQTNLQLLDALQQVGSAANVIGNAGQLGG